MTVLNKKDLASQMAEKLNITNKAAAEYINELLDAIKDALAKGDEVDFSGFGKLEVKERAARKGVNPQTKEPVEIPASKVVKFTAKKALKDAVNGESAQN